MGNSLCADKETKRSKEYFAKHNVSLFYTDQDHNIQSVMCEKTNKFILEDDSFHSWWRMRTIVGEAEVIGSASRLHFYPTESTKEEENQVWYFDEMSRGEAEDLLSHTANDQGSFLVRFSNKHKKLVLSVKTYNEQLLSYQIRHFSIRHTPNWGHGSSFYSLQDNIQFTSLSDLVSSYQEDESSLPLSSVCLIPNPMSDISVLRSWELQIQADKWMVPRDELELGIELGHGYFGAVHKGIWRKEIEVAIKTLRDKEGRLEVDFVKEKNTFLSETEIMKRLNHPNLVKMLGICVEKSPFYLVQELCQYGDLKNYLKAFEFIKVYQNIDYIHNKKSDKFKDVPSYRSLVSWCQDILKGMSYLESLNLVHRDLAARNILLDSHLKAKVGDFGLTMKNNIELNEEKPAMAVLWSAPEAIEKKDFSIKSDVWSFGITMWEIFSYADKPYPGLKKEAVKEKLRSSNHMMDPPPNYMRYDKSRWQQIYQVMKECWSKNPRYRPKFKTLSVNLSKLNTNISKLNKNREAWSASKVRRNSLFIDINDKDVEDYDVSLNTSSYDYEVFRAVHRDVSRK